MSSQSIWVKLDRYPPVIVRVLAKASPELLLTDEELVQRAGGKLSLADVKHLSYLPTWDHVPVAKMRAFCTAAGVDFAKPAVMRRLNRYLRSGSRFRHLQRDPKREEYMRMLAVYIDHESRSKPSR